MFFYNLSRNGKMPGSAQEIRYINRDENTHLWLFRNIITELQKEQPELFTAESVQALREMMCEGVEQVAPNEVTERYVRQLESDIVADHIMPHAISCSTPSRIISRSACTLSAVNNSGCSFCSSVMILRNSHKCVQEIGRAHV